MRTNGIVDLEDDEHSKDSLLKQSRRSVSIDERPMGKLYKQQPPFQPGSTPVDLEHRYVM